jgi:fumarate hydratase subunit alpha
MAELPGKQASEGCRNMRTLETSEIIRNIKEMCIEANHFLAPDMEEALRKAQDTEKAPLGKQILGQLQENLQIAGEDMIPICQDTGMAVVFLEIGQELHITGGSLEEAVNEGVRQGYVEGYLRKSVVKDPLIRENTKDNTPAVIHYEIVPGEQLRITIAPKGFGSENMSRIFMLKPADGIEGVKNAILTAVKDAGPNACPPMVVGVGIGGTFEKCAVLAKKALTRPVNEHSTIPYVKELEEELLEKINKTGIGPGGLGGTTTALAVNINTYPTHIAGLPVAINICCHVNRHAVRVL